MRNIILIVILLAFTISCQQQKELLININGLTMGTTYTVKLVSDSQNLDKDLLHSDIEELLVDINNSMSTYIDDSELSRLNQSRESQCQEISDELLFVIDHAIDVSDVTNAAFDITIGPLVNLWGFGPEPSEDEVPTDEEIESIKLNTGYKNIRLDKTARCISKTNPDVYIDLSGIAKGYAVDKIANYLNESGIQHYLVDIGGEIIAKGKNDQQQTWQIGIESADSSSRSVQRVISLNNIAMATSGDYRNYFEKEGVRYSHTIDPKSGKPITHKLASVTVLDKSTMHADALATAFMVSGPEKTLSIADQLNIPVYLIIKTENGFEEKYNNHFTPYFSE